MALANKTPRLVRKPFNAVCFDGLLCVILFNISFLSEVSVAKAVNARAIEPLNHFRTIDIGAVL